MTLSADDLTDDLPLERCPGPTWQDKLDEDSTPIPEYLRTQSPYLNGFDDIPKDRYLSREWHELEKERLWSRVWQFACREEHIPEVGSYIVYDIADQSYIVVPGLGRRDQGLPERLPAPRANTEDLRRSL